MSVLMKARKSNFYIFQIIIERKTTHYISNISFINAAY